jgi:hypothetical protein
VENKLFVEQLHIDLFVVALLTGLATLTMSVISVGFLSISLKVTSKTLSTFFYPIFLKILQMNAKSMMIAHIIKNVKIKNVKILV